MLSTGIRIFFSLGFRKISGHCISFVAQKFASAHVCKQVKQGEQVLVRKYPNQVGPCG